MMHLRKQAVCALANQPGGVARVQ